MKWFKHMSDMASDVKIKRVIKKYGVDGYGLYNYIIELIVRKLESNSPIPDLEETSHDIATDLSMDIVKVEEIMWFCIEQGLFEQDEITGRLVAKKVYKFLETSQTRSPELKKMIDAYKSTVSDSPRLSLPEQNRKEQNRTDSGKKQQRFQKPSIEEIQEYARSIDYSSLDAGKFRDYYESKGWMIGKNKMKDWKAAVRTWKRNEKNLDKGEDRGIMVNTEPLMAGKKHPTEVEE